MAERVRERPIPFLPRDSKGAVLGGETRGRRDEGTPIDGRKTRRMVGTQNEKKMRQLKIGRIKLIQDRDLVNRNLMNEFCSAGHPPWQPTSTKMALSGFLVSHDNRLERQ